MKHASRDERAYFARIDRANRQLQDERPPASLQEALDRIEAIRRAQGPLAQPGMADADPVGDLASHLAYLDHIRRVMKRRASAHT